MQTFALSWIQILCKKCLAIACCHEADSRSSENGGTRSSNNPSLKSGLDSTGLKRPGRNSSLIYKRVISSGVVLHGDKKGKFGPEIFFSIPQAFDISQPWEYYLKLWRRVHWLAALNLPAHLAEHIPSPLLPPLTLTVGWSGGRWRSKGCRKTSEPS